jgi:hypothetical protein
VIISTRIPTNNTFIITRILGCTRCRFDLAFLNSSRRKIKCILLFSEDSEDEDCVFLRTVVFTCHKPEDYNMSFQCTGHLKFLTLDLMIIPQDSAEIKKMLILYKISTPLHAF